MKKIKLYSFILLGLITAACTNGPKDSVKNEIKESNGLPSWALGEFVRPEGINPIITPNVESRFDCPMRKTSVGWEESDTFNPAATIKDGKVLKFRI